RHGEVARFAGSVSDIVCKKRLLAPLIASPNEAGARTCRCEVSCDRQVSQRVACSSARVDIAAHPGGLPGSMSVQPFHPTYDSEQPANGFVVASAAMRNALANAYSVAEEISAAESEGVLEGWRDIELGLVL